jgi:hypothetical protein
MCFLSVGICFRDLSNECKLEANLFSDTFECYDARLMLILILDNINGSRTYQVYSGDRLPMVLERKITEGAHVRLLHLFFDFPQAAYSYFL